MMSATAQFLSGSILSRFEIESYKMMCRSHSTMIKGNGDFPKLRTNRVAFFHKARLSTPRNVPKSAAWWLDELGSRQYGDCVAISVWN